MENNIIDINASKVLPDATEQLFVAQPLLRRNYEYIAPYIREDVSDIHINKPQEVILKLTTGERITIEDKTLTLDILEGFALAFASFEGSLYHSASHPIVSFKLPGGHRVQVVAGAHVPEKFAMAVRLRSNRQFEIEDFGFTPQEKEEIIKAVRERRTLLISGGTGSGKTTFFNCLLRHLSPIDRVISIEGVPELYINNYNKLTMTYSENSIGKGKNVIANLLNASLRLDPDRILIGEIRMENAFMFFRATNTGHEGSMGTIHANSPEEAISALVDNMVMAGEMDSGAGDVPRSQLRERIYGVVQLNRNVESHKIGGYFIRFNNESKGMATHNNPIKTVERISA